LAFIVCFLSSRPPKVHLNPWSNYWGPPHWLERHRVPETYCQVFFDSVFAINFLDIFAIIASGDGYSIETPAKSQEKSTIMIPITRGAQVGKATSLPTFAAEHRVTELGRPDAYVVPQGGGFALDAAAMKKVLLPVD
jgi:hypothetical protein